MPASASMVTESTFFFEGPSSVIFDRFHWTFKIITSSVLFFTAATTWHGLLLPDTSVLFKTL